MLACGVGAMLMFAVLGGTKGVFHVAFFLWGLAFGPLVTMYQAAVSTQVADAKAVAPSKLISHAPYPIIFLMVIHLNPTD